MNILRWSRKAFEIRVWVNGKFYDALKYDGTTVDFENAIKDLKIAAQEGGL